MRLLLPVDAHAGVRRAVGSVMQPAPAAVIARQQPDRAAEPTCQMGDRGIDGDDKIKVRHQRSGVGEVCHIGHGINQLQSRPILFRAVLLQAYQVDRILERSGKILSISKMKRHSTLLVFTILIFM